MSAKSKAEHNTAQAARRVHAELKALRANNARLVEALEDCAAWMCEAEQGTDQWERGQAALTTLAMLKVPK